MKLPKTIANHPAVQEVCWGEDQGFDYKYHVYLKPEWRFTRGRMGGCRTGNFNDVARFLFAEPRPATEAELKEH